MCYNYFIEDGHIFVRKGIIVKNQGTHSKLPGIKWLLCFYDFIVYAASVLAIFVLRGFIAENPKHFLLQFGIGFVCLLLFRLIFKVYQQIWRYGSMQAYARLFAADLFGGGLYALIQIPLGDPPPAGLGILFVDLLAVICLNLMGCTFMRMAYLYIYRYGSNPGKFNAALRWIMRVFTGTTIHPDTPEEIEAEHRKIKVAIVGAGRVGATLAEELLSNPKAAYLPCVFFEESKGKIGRELVGLPVLAESRVEEAVVRYGIQEFIIAIPQKTAEEKRAIYEQYKATGCKVKVYDYPTAYNAKGDGKRTLREFDIEELLFRKEVDVIDDDTREYYRNKVVLITGGGGSIGSELCRQIAAMKPKLLVVLDVCENGAYDIQQELKIAYGTALDLRVEILSVCDRPALERVFATYHPQVVLHAAAHKHVPLMEHNCCEAVWNNVFGTYNCVELSEQYGVERFMMVSTDKAVNPTNVMGATKRLCEMIVQAHSATSKTSTFSATRFGNVLGSAGSVIPLFKRQIANGGPLTITDKRIIRYFMTIPEASQLVLQSGAMAQNGELFVLDMGKPVKILEMAENMIRLSGLEPYVDIDIVETGLRPGEKLYEELLVKDERLDKTKYSQIFVERDRALTLAEIEEKLGLLRAALAAGNDDEMRTVMHKVVPTYKTPEEINAEAAKAEEMKEADKSGDPLPV